ncbi:MAG: hypothetical protein AAF613_01485 [Pseudomonadota bacterium]
MSTAFVILIALFGVSGCVMQHKNRYVPIADSNLDTRLAAQKKLAARLIEGSYQTPPDDWRGRETPVRLPRLELCLSDGRQLNLHGARIIEDQICGSDRGWHFNSETDWASELESTCYPLGSLEYKIESYEGTVFGLYPMTRAKIRCPA